MIYINSSIAEGFVLHVSRLQSFKYIGLRVIGDIRKGEKAQTMRHLQTTQ